MQIHLSHSTINLLERPIDKPGQKGRLKLNAMKRLIRPDQDVRH